MRSSRSSSDADAASRSQDGETPPPDPERVLFSCDWVEYRAMRPSPPRFAGSGAQIAPETDFYGRLFIDEQGSDTSDDDDNYSSSSSSSTPRGRRWSPAYRSRDVRYRRGGERDKDFEFEFFNFVPEPSTLGDTPDGRTYAEPVPSSSSSSRRAQEGAISPSVAKKVEFLLLQELQADTSNAEAPPSPNLSRRPNERQCRRHRYHHDTLPVMRDSPPRSQSFSRAPLTKGYKTRSGSTLTDTRFKNRHRRPLATSSNVPPVLEPEQETDEDAPSSSSPLTRALASSAGADLPSPKTEEEKNAEPTSPEFVGINLVAFEKVLERQRAARRRDAAAARPAPSNAGHENHILRCRTRRVRRLEETEPTEEAKPTEEAQELPMDTMEVKSPLVVRKLMRTQEIKKKKSSSSKSAKKDPKEVKIWSSPDQMDPKDSPDPEDPEEEDTKR